MNATLWISIAAIFISVASFVNSWLSRRHTKIDYLFSLRKQTLLKAKEIEIEWQQVLNDIYHFIHKVNVEEGDSLQKQSVVKYVMDLNDTFTESHKNFSNIRNQLEKNFEKISEKEAKHCLTSFEGQKISLTTSRVEMLRKLSILSTKLKTEKMF